MCSICGVATEEPEPLNAQRVLDMLRLTRHRGPDGCGVFWGKHAYAPTPETLADALPASAGESHVLLAQSRLAITGSLRAQQPFVSSDGKLALAHNGEIYNHRELAALLGGDVQLSTGSDSEVLMRVLEHHYEATDGDLAEAMLRAVGVASGMYAIAATDGRALVLARDSVGKKPLYYVNGERTFAFASERKALVDVAEAEAGIIERLQPGEVLTWTPGSGVALKTAERLSAPQVDVTDLEEAVSQYKEALELSIARRTRGLDKAAVFFSGGVDSVFVARLLQRAGLDVDAYVCGTADSSDVRYAIEVAKEMGLDVRVLHVDEDLLEAWLPRILESIELHGPMMAETSVPMWFSAKAAHEDGHRVVFTGQAADELFAGYTWYRKVIEEQGHLTLHARLWEDIRALPLDTLEREDRISMAWSLELRAPFLDTDVIRCAMRIAPQVKMTSPDDGYGKHPHRLLAKRLGVPESVAYREKVPAQDGASIHDLLLEVATRRFPEGIKAAVEVPDFGSNYRYRDAPGKYGAPEVQALLAEIVREGRFVVAEADGSALPPNARTPLPVNGRLPVQGLAAARMQP